MILWTLLAGQALAQVEPLPAPAEPPAFTAPLRAAPEAETLEGLSRSLGQAEGLPPSGRIEPVLRDYLEGLPKIDPETASRLGLHGADSRLTFYDAKSARRLEAFYARLSLRLARIPSSSLSFDERIDRRLLAAEFDSQGGAASLENVLDAPLTTITNHFLYDYAPERERHETALARLEQYPRVLRQGRRGIEAASRFEISTARADLPGAKQACAEFAAKLLEGLPEQRGRIERAAAAAARELDRFEGFLAELPVDRTGWRSGRAALDDAISAHLAGVDSAELLRRIHKAQRRTLSELEETAERLFPGLSWRKALKKLERHPEPSALLDAYREALRRAERHVVEKGLATPPDAGMQVHATPEYERVAIPFAAYEGALPLDGTRTGHFFATLPPKDASPAELEAWFQANGVYEIVDLNAVHEGFPGHHVQLGRAKEAANPVRRIVWDIFLGEGWAHYIEGLMSETGFLGPTGTLSMLFERRWALARARVTIGLHAEGWSARRATRYIRRMLGIPWADAESSVTRYAVLDPMESLAYSMGRLEILGLRERTERRLGPRFSLKEFHDRLLSYGALPFPLLERLLERDWK